MAPMYDFGAFFRKHESNFANKLLRHGTKDNKRT